VRALPPPWDARLSRRALGRLALGLGVGAAGGAAAEAAGVPLAWMLGALFLCMAVRMAGAPIEVPVWFRTLFMGLIGLFLGESFAGVGWAELSRWPLTLAAAVLYVPAGAALGYLLLRRAAGFERGTALLSALPGGLTAVAIFADEAGGDSRRVALSHSFRVALVILIAPAVAFGLLGLPEPTAGSFAALGVIGAGDFALLAAASALAAWGMARIGWPVPWLLGPLAASAALRMPGLVEGGLPAWTVEWALLVSGASIGTRFHGVGWRVFASVALWTAAVTALLLALSAGFALAVWAALGVPLFSALLAYAPGGVAEMSLIAIAIDADPAFVATHHMARIFAILFALPLIAGALRRLLAADRAGRGSPPGSRPPREAP